MLETLRQGEGPRPVPAESGAAAWPAEDEGAPYIEVGGPGKLVELSPGLIAHEAHVTSAAQPAVQPPHPPVEKTLAAKAPVVDLTAARPMTVAFEPWPVRPAGPLRVAPEVIAYHHPDHPVSREYAALFARILNGQAGPGTAVLLLAGLRPHVGATTVLLNLAVAAAGATGRACVLDAHWSHPDLAARLGHAAPAGVQEALAGSLALEAVVLKTAVPALDLLPASAPGTTAGPLTAEALTWLTAWLRERYDVVLIDGPSLAEPAELARLAPRCDGVYLVLPQGETPAVPRGPAGAIPRMGGRLRGLIHTHFEA
jgi:Mrp family chromosome partitioning ATPase